MNSSVHALPVLRDNIVWILIRGQHAVVVDPATAAPVRDWLQERGLELRAVLQTHHHPDHIGGTGELLATWPKAEVIASGQDRDRIPFQTISVEGGDRLTVIDTPIEVIDVAAHTRAHIAFYVDEADDPAIGPVLFCGDTLFSAGCGRVLEGTAADMHRALQRINRLPADTAICCAHEYTEANLRWAVQQRPENAVLASRLKDVEQKRRQGELTLPSTLRIERATNLFLQASSATELAQLRQHKDDWRG